MGHSEMRNGAYRCHHVQLLHEQCEITLYAHPVIEDFDHFLNTGEAPSAQDRWKHVRSLQVSHQQYSYESLTDDDVSYVR